MQILLLNYFILIISYFIVTKINFKKVKFSLPFGGINFMKNKL